MNDCTQERCPFMNVLDCQVENSNCPYYTQPSTADFLYITYDTHGLDLPTLGVFRRMRGNSIKAVNVIQGGEARELYLKLITGGTDNG